MSARALGGLNVMPDDSSQRFSGASSDAIRFHYDTGADFFRGFLGRTMAYSAARFAAEDEDLDLAQDRKLQHHLDTIGAASGFRLLDIGCGWGSAIRAGIVAYDIKSAVGLTLSDEQHRHVNSLGLAGVESRLQSYEWFEPDELFDGALSIGSFEHFSKPGLDRNRRLSIYRNFFSRARSFLRRRGRLSLQTITWGQLSADQKALVRLEDYFPESDLPEIAEVVTAASPYFRLLQLENRPDDYAITLRRWMRALAVNEVALVGLTGAERHRFYVECFRGGLALFRSRRLNLCRFGFERL